jgi:hypothetical protein
MVDRVRAKWRRLCAQEREARESVINLTRDPNTNPTDRKVDEAKRAVITAATLVEELAVYCHEFARNPDREYHLSSGDVVFFDLIDADIQAATLQAITPSN